MEAPSQEIFNDMKQAAIKVWETYNNDFGYVDEKLERINHLKNTQDNAMIMYNMFDHINKSKMANNLKRNDSVIYIRSNLY